MKIKINLDDANSINAAIAELKEYRKRLQDKLVDFVRELALEGVVVARTYIGQAAGDTPRVSDPDYVIDASGDIIRASIFIEGNDVLFIEFGAGIQFNPVDPPHAAEFGYGVGTYPSEHPPNKAINPGYWWYRDDGGNRRLSVGMEGTYPMYRAAENARNTYIQKAVEALARG